MNHFAKVCTEFLQVSLGYIVQIEIHAIFANGQAQFTGTQKNEILKLVMEKARAGVFENYFQQNSEGTEKRHNIMPTTLMGESVKLALNFERNVIGSHSVLAMSANRDEKFCIPCKIYKEKLVIYSYPCESPKETTLSLQIPVEGSETHSTAQPGAGALNDISDSSEFIQNQMVFESECAATASYPKTPKQAKGFKMSSRFGSSAKPWSRLRKRNRLSQFRFQQANGPKIPPHHKSPFVKRKLVLRYCHLQVASKSKRNIASSENFMVDDVNKKELIGENKINARDQETHATIGNVINAKLSVDNTNPQRSRRLTTKRNLGSLTAVNQNPAVLNSHKGSSDNLSVGRTSDVTKCSVFNNDDSQESCANSKMEETNKFARDTISQDVVASVFDLCDEKAAVSSSVLGNHSFHKQVGTELSTSTNSLIHVNSEAPPATSLMCLPRDHCESNVEICRSTLENVQQSTSNPPRSAASHCISSVIVVSDDDDDVDVEIKALSSVQELTQVHLKHLVHSNENYLRKIFEGKINCQRHKDYKADGPARRALSWTLPVGIFSDKQYSWILCSLTEIFCKNHQKFLDYVMMVLLPEVIIKIFMHIYDLGYEEAESKISENSKAMLLNSGV